MADVELKGVREMVTRLNAKPAQVRDACGRGLFQFGSKIMTESKTHYAPRSPKGGALRNSAQVRPAEYRRHEVSVELAYGGDAGAYAIAVHEHPSAHSPRSWQGKTIQWSMPGTGPKFLETPLKLYGTPTAMNVYLAGPIREALERA